MNTKAKVLVGSVIAAPMSAFAALPLAATTAITDAQTDSLALIDAVWPYVAAVAVGFVILKLFKRGINKA